MLPGQQASYNGYQYCLFPLDYINCTQVGGPGSLSHCCGHPADYTGPYDNYPYYAPCDCTRIWSNPSNGESLYTSDAPVWTPSGLRYVSFLFSHDDNTPAAVHFNQGDLIGHTGTTGFALGDHVHLDQSLIHNDSLVNYGVTCAGGNVCYALGGSAYPDNVFYISGSETIVNTHGMTFQTVPDHPGQLSTAALILLMAKYKERKQKHGRIQRI